MTTRLSALCVASVCALLTVTSAGCYDTPKPKCAFLCGTAGECPLDYMCGPADNRCHLVEDNGALAVCEDPLPGDAAVIDAPIDAGNALDGAVDGAVDAAIVEDDAAVTTHTGTISIQEVSVLGVPQLGSGLSVSIDFPPVNPPRPPDVVEGGLTNGCSAWLYDLSTGDVPNVGGDEGTVIISGTTAHMPTPDPGPPPAGCVFVPGKGYLCLDGAGAGATTIMPLGGGAVLLTIAGATPLATDPGHYISLAGLTSPSNNGAFPVLSIMGGSWVIGNAAAVAEAGTTTGQYQLVAGAGPVPTSPEALADSDMVTVGIVPGGGNHIDFPDTAPVNVGDAFAPNAATQMLMTNLPDTAAAPLIFSCAGDPGCAAGSAGGSIIVIQTTDAVIPAGAPSYYFPAPTGKLAIIQCRAIATDTITMSTAIQAVLASSNATRSRTTFFRDGFVLTGNPDGLNGTNIVAGHGVIGFSDHVQCILPSDCGVSTDCLTHTCVANVCGMTFQPSGSPTASQSSGDCQQTQCNGTGGVVSVDDNSDTPNDGIECTDDFCTTGSPSSANSASGTVCSMGGNFCNGAGACVECLMGSTCPGTDTECQTRTCTTNMCGLSFATTGTACTVGGTMCDGAGNCL